jgi:hypothetical protein
MNKMALQEQRSILNDLFSDAMAAYWNWVKSVRVLKIVDQNLRIAEARVSFVKRSVELGERPAVDTVEATTQQQYFDNLFQAKWMEKENSRLALSVYLWQENNTPQELPLEVQPAEVKNEMAILADLDLNLSDGEFIIGAVTDYWIRLFSNVELTILLSLLLINYSSLELFLSLYESFLKLFLI